MKELTITKEDIELLKEMKNNCLKASVYDDEKRLLKANAITKFLVEHEEKQELIDYLKEGICFLKEKILKKSLTENSFTITLFTNKLSTYKEILSKIEKEVKYDRLK